MFFFRRHIDNLFHFTTRKTDTVYPQLVASTLMCLVCELIVGYANTRLSQKDPPPMPPQKKKKVPNRMTSVHKCSCSHMNIED